MKKLIKNSVIYAALLVILVTTGIVWRSREITNVRNTGYGKNMRLSMNFTTTKPTEDVNRWKESIKKDHLYVLEESESGDYFWEMIGQTNRFWVLSSSLHKTTIIADPTSQQDKNGAQLWEIRIFDRRVRSGSMLYFAIVVLTLMTAVVLKAKIEWLSQIFADDSGNTHPVENVND